jgi:hypothetical protein
MHSRSSIKIFITLSVLWFSCAVEGQTRRVGDFNLIEGMSITAKGGYNMFFGDLVDKSRGSYTAGVLVDRELSEILGARVRITGGEMQGTQIDASSKQIYASFNNVYGEFSVGGDYKPLNHLLGYFKQRTLQPYAHLNTGLVYYNSTEYWGRASGNTPGTEWRSTSEITPIISMGGGAKIWINPVITANIELVGTLPFSDRMDVHDVWYDPQNNMYTTAPYDFYYTIMAGITFVLQDSKFSNDPKYNRKSYIKTRSYYQSKSRRTPAKRPDERKKFLFF